MNTVEERTIIVSGRVAQRLIGTCHPALSRSSNALLRLASTVTPTDRHRIRAGAAGSEPLEKPGFRFCMKVHFVILVILAQAGIQAINVDSRQKRAGMTVGRLGRL